MQCFHSKDWRLWAERIFEDLPSQLGPQRAIALLQIGTGLDDPPIAVRLQLHLTLRCLKVFREISSVGQKRLKRVIFIHKLAISFSPCLSASTFQLSLLLCSSNPKKYQE